MALWSSASSAKVQHVYHVMKKAGHVGKVVKTKHQGESGGHATKSTNSIDKKPLSDYQRSILMTAYKQAEHDGIKKPEILSGIIMQESAAGAAKNFRTAKHKKACDQTVGLGQMKVKTALAILTKYPELKQQFGVSDRNLYSALATNDKFSLAVASKYVKWMYDIYHNDDTVIAAYNLGPGGAANLKKPWNLPYVKLVRGHINRHQFSTTLS